MFISFVCKSFFMIKHVTIASIFILTVLALAPAVSNNFAIGQTNTTGSEGSGGNNAKMHVDEALKALQSNDNAGATMHLNEASNSAIGSAKMHVDEALKALQSNDNAGATMHTQEAQKNL
jgi:hypothetical protein